MIRKHLQIKGIVQGVGFRPFVWQCADRLGLTGWVNNDSTGVTVEIQGTFSQTEKFLAQLQETVPSLARVDSIAVTDVKVVSETSFTIVESSVAENQSTPISPEISICSECLREMFDREDRRYQYPFINCTNCGPRFTIVEDIPYDRSLTTMKSFAMCEACQDEYDDPSNRRFHAQPNACHECGPGLWFVSDQTEPLAFERKPESGPVGHSAVEMFHHAIEQGLVVGVKGIGGFHLACDATNELAVKRLRQVKGRVDKPLAVMVRDVEQARRFARINRQERQLLESKERPVVLLSRTHASSSSRCIPCSAVAPGNDFIGVLLPYSPLHYLLVGESPLVMTSGNLSEEPIVRTNQEAKQRLGKMADCFLLHDRTINLVCDDSVVRCVNGKLLPIRRSRGFSPMPVRLDASGPSELAVGGEIKSTFCVTRDDYAYLSQHIGDMGNLETLQAMQRCVEHFLRLFRVVPQAVVADLHPSYLSGQWAEEFARTIGVPLLRVQHHYAHIASLITESELPPDQRIIGCCFDGTGYGTDGAIWGGEFMIANGIEFDHVAQLKYTPLPGGDASIGRPYRVALAQLWSNGIDWSEILPCVAACPQKERVLLRQQLEQNLNCALTSSMGRLFDAAASVIGVRHEVNYEAQAAMELEALATGLIDRVDPEAYEFRINQDSIIEIGAADVLGEICADYESGISPAIIAAQFHHAVARMVVEVCELLRDKTNINQVGLTGGVFQNVLLLKLTELCLIESGFEVYLHRVVPPNDGGIALGQAIVVRNQLAGNRPT